MTFERLTNKIARAYSLWRIRPTPEEVRSHNDTDRILLTFDDFTDEVSLHKLLAILKDKNVRAAFFLIGEWTEKNPALVEEIKVAGHWVGNHSYSHRHLTKLSSSEVEAEIARGVASALLRPPYGSYDARIRSIAAKLGYRISFWTVDSDDWKGISATNIHENVVRDLHPGACILMHLNGPHTIEALPSIIDTIRERGFELCYEGTEIKL